MSAGAVILAVLSAVGVVDFGSRRQTGQPAVRPSASAPAASSTAPALLAPAASTAVGAAARPVPASREAAPQAAASLARLLPAEDVPGLTLAGSGGPGYLRPWFVPVSGPPRVAIQAGHWLNESLPLELRHLIGNTGGEVERIEEYELNLAVARALAARLRARGMVVELVPATVPPALRADAFIAIHCDWAPYRKNSGWKAAPPENGNPASHLLAEAVEASFIREDRVSRDVASISENMSDYYAFNHTRYRHSVSPFTPSAIVELGFMSNPEEFRLLRREPEFWAGVLERAMVDFLARAPRGALPLFLPKADPALY